MLRNRNCLISVSILLALSCFVGLAISRAQLPPNNRRPLDLTQYIYGVSDPKQAAMQLEKAALERGIDLDHVGRTADYSGTGIEYDPFNISTVQRSFVPAPIMDNDFRASLTRMIQEGKGDSLMICILQFNRKLSLREVAFVMRMGVTFYNPLSELAYPAKISPNVSLELLSRPYVRWIGEYRDTDKYWQLDKLPTISTCYIQSFEGDKPAFRSDLAALGIKVLRYNSHMRTYYVEAGKDRFAGIAALWWVRRISMPVNPSFDDVRIAPE